MELFSIPVIYRESKHDRGVRVLLPLDHLLYLRVIGKCIHFYGIRRKEIYFACDIAGLENTSGWHRL